MRTTVAFFLYLIAMVSGLIFTAYKPTAPYLAFASNLTIGFGAYITKRLLQKKEEFAGIEGRNKESRNEREP